MKSILEQYIFQKNNIPLVRLINIRSDSGMQLPENVTDIKKDPLFTELPVFPTKNIKEFFNSLQNQNTIQKSLEILNFQMNYNDQFVDLLYNSLHSRESITDARVFCFIYQCLAFIRLDDSLRKETEYVKIFNIMNLTITSPFHIFFADIFKELLTDLLSKFNVEWDITLLNTILRQIVSNNSFDTSFSKCLENLILKIVSTKNTAMVETLLSVLVIFFEENKPSIQNISCSTIVSSISNYISHLDLNSLVVLGYCSQKEPNSVTIIYRYQSLIKYVLSLSSQHPPIYQPTSFFPSIKSKEIRDEKGELSEESTFEAPPENLIHCESDIGDICCNQLKLYSTRLQSLFTLSSKFCIETFIQSTVETQRIIEISVYSIDFSILIASCLECLAKKTTIGQLVQYFIKSKIFDPKHSIFSKEGLNPTISVIRNSIFKIISSIDSSFFYNFIQSATLHPLLLAEHIMRLSYKYGNMFFAHTIILNSLLTSINVLQKECSTIQKSHSETAKKVILSVVISLLDESDFAFVFFSDDKFCKLFTDLLLEPTTTEIATSVFVKCVSKFPSLPNSTIHFISFILKKCNTNLTKLDKSTTNGAISLVKAVISAISHKISLGISVSIIFDETLKFLKNYIDSNPETLEMTMSICALITRSQNSIEVNSERYNSILDIIDKIEKKEPSDSTFQSFLNQLNASTNTGIDQMFLIQTSEVIPIILASFSQSKRLKMIIDLFQQLCLFSVKNIIELHNGDLSYILLKALVGPFVYKERTLNFIIPKEIIESVFKLISNVVSYRSSFLIDDTFLNLIFPDLVTHQFLPISEQATMSLYQLFTQQDKSIFQVCTESPVFIIKDIDGTQLQEGFAFSFLAKIDLASILQYKQGSFVYLEIKDKKKHVLRISQQQDSLLATYYSTPTSNVLQIMTIPITSNKWICITVFFYYEDKRTIICFKAGNKTSDDAKFRSIVFEKVVDVSIGFTKGLTIPPSELSPVSMNHFALFLPPFDDHWFDSISSNGFIELSHFSNIAFHSHSKNCLINAIAKRKNLSITNLMPLHTKLSDFIEIFKYSHSQSPLFKELALRSVFLFTNCMSKSISGAAYSFLPNDLHHLDKLESFTHVPEQVLKKFYKFSENLFTIHMTDLSIFFSSFILTNAQKEHFFLPVALELIELTTDTECHIELFESVILNIWLWCNSTEQATFKKNLRSLTHFLTQYSFPSNFGDECLFSEFLIQAHFLCNYSKEQYSFIDSYRFRILESLPITHKDIETITSIILYNYHNHDKTLFNDDKEYCLPDEKRCSEIINYIEFLTLISSLKHLTYQKKVLLALTDIVTNSSIQIVEKLIGLLKVAAGENLHDCYLDIALKSDDIKIFDLLDDSFDIICIETIKSQSTTKFFSFINDKSKSLKNNELWWLWLSLTAAITQKKEIINEIISNILHNDVSMIFSFYSLFLSIFSILRLTKVFPHVNEIINLIISGVLDSIEHSSQTIPYSIQYSIAILSLFGLFHKLRNVFVPSKAILYLINEFDDLDDLFKNKNKHIKRINGSNTTNQIRNVFYPNNFTLTNLKIIFSYANLENYQFKYWLSHSKPINMKSIRSIKSILDFLLKNSNDSFASIKHYSHFVNKLVGNSKIDLFAAESIFTKFSYYNENNVILNEMKRQLSFCWNVIKSFLSNSLHKFDYEQVFFPSVSFELFRFSKLFCAANDKEEKSVNNFSHIPISRFTKFPLVFRSKKMPNLNVDTPDSSSNKLDNLNLIIQAKKSSDNSLCSSTLLYTSSFSFYPPAQPTQPLLSFPCHIITQNDPQSATFVILKNEFRLLQLAKPLISIPFTTIKCLTNFRTGFIEIFLSAFSSYLLTMNTDDINSLLSYLGSFSQCSTSSSSFLSNDLLPFPILTDGSMIEQMLIDNQSMKSLSVYDTVLANILALNFAKGRSFNDLSFYPIFPQIWDGKFLSDMQKVVLNMNYSKFLYFWLHKFSNIENRIASDIYNNSHMKNKDANAPISSSSNNDTNIASINNNDDNIGGELDDEKAMKVNFSEFLLEMPKCAVPHLFNCNCNFIDNFSNISSHDMIISIYRNRKIIEKKTFRKLIAKWFQMQFNTTFNLKRHSKSLELSLSVFFEEKLSLSKKDGSRDLVTIKRTKRVRFCKFFDGNKDAFSCIVEKPFIKTDQKGNKEESLLLTMKVFSLSGIKSVGDGNLNPLLNGIAELYIHHYIKVPIAFNPDHDLLFCSLRHLIVVINRTRCIGHLIFIPTLIYEFSIPTNITGICGVDNTLILIVDNHIIIACSIEKIPETNNTNKIECNNSNEIVSDSANSIVIIDDEGQIQNKLLKNVIACEDNEILIFTSSTVFNVLVYQTKDYKLKVLSIYDSLLLAEIQLHERINNLIITEENGFIVCKSDNEITIYTLNGNLVNKNKLLSKFVVVTQCRSPKGIDFILYINEKGDLGMFEAIYPLERKILLSGLKNVIEMKVCKRKPILVLILKSGEILSYPISFKILFELCI